MVQQFWQKAASQGEDFSLRQCNVTPIRLEHCSRLSCCYWGLNDPFCCIYRSRDSHCFSMDRTTPKLPFFMRDLDPHLIHAFLNPHESAPKTASRSVDPFFHTSPVCQTHADRQTDRHTDHATCGTACMRCGLKTEKQNDNIIKVQKSYVSTALYK